MSERKIKEFVKEEKLGGYVECSALVGGDEIEEVFQTGARLSLIQLGVLQPTDSKPTPEKGVCHIC